MWLGMNEIYYWVILSVNYWSHSQDAVQQCKVWGWNPIFTLCHLIRYLPWVRAGRRPCFQVIAAHHATTQGIAGKWVRFETIKVIFNAKDVSPLVRTLLPFQDSNLQQRSDLCITEGVIYDLLWKTNYLAFYVRTENQRTTWESFPAAHIVPSCYNLTVPEIRHLNTVAMHCQIYFDCTRC